MNPQPSIPLGAATATQNLAATPSHVFGKQEAARRLGISQRSLEALFYGRKISFRRVGRLVKFTTSDIENYLDSCRVPTLAEIATPARRRNIAAK